MGCFSFTVGGAGIRTQNIVMNEALYICSKQDESYVKGYYNDYGNFVVKGYENEVDVYALEGYLMKHDVSFLHAIAELEQLGGRGMEFDEYRSCAIDAPRFTHLVMCYDLLQRDRARNEHDPHQGWGKWYDTPDF